MRGYFVHERIAEAVDEKGLPGTQASHLREPNGFDDVTLNWRHDGRYDGRRQQDDLSEPSEPNESSRNPPANTQPSTYRLDLESPTGVLPFASLAASLKQTGNHSGTGDSCLRVAPYCGLCSLAVFTEDTCGDMV